MRLTIKLNKDEYDRLREALRLAAGSRIPNTTQRMALSNLRELLADAAAGVHRIDALDGPGPDGPPEPQWLYRGYVTNDTTPKETT